MPMTNEVPKKSVSLTDAEMDRQNAEHAHREILNAVDNCWSADLEHMTDAELGDLVDAVGGLHEGLRAEMDRRKLEGAGTQ